MDSATIWGNFKFFKELFALLLGGTARMRYAGAIGVCLCVFSLAALGCSAPGARGRAGPDRVGAALLNDEGLQFMRDGQHSEAEHRFRAAIGKDPFMGPAHCNLGVALLKQGKAPYEAALTLRHAAELMPRSAEPHTNLGILYSMVGQYGSGEVHLREALRLAPSDIEIIGQLALLQVRQGRTTPEARDWLQTIARQDRDEAWRSWAAGELSRWPSESTARGKDMP